MHLFDSYISYKVIIFLCFNIFKVSICFVINKISSKFFWSLFLFITFNTTFSLVYNDFAKYILDDEPSLSNSSIS